MGQEEEAVRLLGGSMGYGRLMQLCEQLWNAEVPGGGHCVGPPLESMVRCLHPDKSTNGHCGWCCDSGRVTKRVQQAQVTAEGVEPGAGPALRENENPSAMLLAETSAAISLKRIADAVQGHTGQLGLADMIGNAVYNAITSACSGSGQ